MLVACGCGCPLVGGTFCAVSQKCTRTILGSDLGPGCFFLVLRGKRGAGECVFLVYPLTQKLRSSRMWRLGRGPSSHVSLRMPLEEFPFHGLLLALFALGNVVHYLLVALYLSECCLRNTVIGSIGRLSGYCRNACLDSGYTFCASALLLNVISHFFYVEVDSNLKCSLSVLTQNGEVCSADASVF